MLAASGTVLAASGAFWLQGVPFLAAKGSLSGWYTEGVHVLGVRDSLASSGVVLQCSQHDTSRLSVRLFNQTHSQFPFLFFVQTCRPVTKDWQ